MNGNKWDKKKKAVAAIYVIVLLVYSLFFWMIPLQKKTDNVTAYLFSCLAFLISYAATCKAFQSTDDLTEKLYGYPVFRIGCIYAGVQFAVSLVVDCISALVTIPFWLVFIVCVLCLGVACVGMITADTARETVSEVYQEAERNIQTIRNFQMDISSYIGLCQTEKERQEIEKLAEDFRFSDPVSSELLEPVEEKIRREVEQLGSMFDQEEETVLRQIRLVENLLADRNHRCKAGK